MVVNRDPFDATRREQDDARLVTPSELVELRRSERMYRSLVEHLAHEVHIWNLVRDAAGAIVSWSLEYANPAALKAWGRRLDEVIGRRTEEIFAGTDPVGQFMPTVQQVLRDNKPLIWEEYFPATGQTLQMVTIPIENGFVSTGLDVSEQHATELELEQARRMDSIGQLAGGVAHDFNNQLTAILGYAEMLEDSLAGEFLEVIHHIQTAARRSADLTAQLLAFARTGPAEFEPVEAEALIHEVVAMLKRSITKHIEIRCDLHAQGVNVLGDASLLENALLNIALNARDAMSDQGVLTFTTEVVELDADACTAPGTPDAPGGYLRIDIEDTGLGMPEAVRARIFEPFFTTKATGNGMGMAGVLGTVQRHKGGIEVESEPGVGTRMRVYLPLAPPSDESAETHVEDEEFDGHPLRILVADDEHLLRELCGRLLERFGHTVIKAVDGREAVEIYEREGDSIDLVILDINMPRLNGIEAFQLIQRMNPCVRALMASGYGADATPGDMLREGVVGFVQKPFGRKELQREIRLAMKPN